MRLKSFIPCLAPEDNVSKAGTFSAKSVAVIGKSYRTQCTQVPTGASGSSQIRARPFTPAGTPLHCSGGEMSAPSHVYLVGIVCPAWKAELVTSIVIGIPSLFRG